MPKNKYPEKTVAQILDIAEGLFFTRGYDKTSIQDITTKLNMTKGAIYHHFSSKKEIYDAVVARMVPISEEEIQQQVNQNETALEKLKKALLDTANALKYQKVIFSAKSLINNPQILGEIYLSTFEDTSATLKKYINEGIQDGSITTNSPDVLAQFIPLITNLWLGPRLASMPEKELSEILIFSQKVCREAGVDLFDEQIINSLKKLNKELRNNS